MKTLAIAGIVSWILLSIGWYISIVENKCLVREIVSLQNHLDHAKGYIEQVNEEYNIEPFIYVHNIFSEDMCTVTRLAVNYTDEELPIPFGYKWVTGGELP